MSVDLLCRAANLAWLATAVPAWRAYRRALDDPRRAQLDRLRRLLVENAGTAYGRDHRFSWVLEGLQSGVDRRDERLLDRYRTVPMSGYEDYRGYVERIRTGEAGVLTSEPVERLVPTGGSTAGPKLVPFTRGLRREFDAAVRAWIAGIFVDYPSVAGGPAYWSITPAAAQDHNGRVPVGFEHDSEYLGAAARLFARAVLAAPDELARVRDPASFSYLTLLFLLRSRALRLVSVWHPSFLTRLLDELPELLPNLASDIARGTASPPGTLDSGLRRRLESVLRPDPGRARELLGAAAHDVRSIWPALALVSCWADTGASAGAEALRLRLPGIPLQAKGLLATEGVVSIPFGGCHPVAVTSHVYEFVDAAGTPHLVDELQTGVEYTILLTTGGGLYRYCLGDRIILTGRVGRTPSIRFVGRGDRVSDVCGEKLTDAFAARVIARLFEGRPPRFVMLAPERRGAAVWYTLFVDAAAARPGLDVLLEQELRRNPQYAWSVDMRQLGHACVAAVGPAAERTFVETCVSRGQRLGDVKVPSLHPETGWAERLGGTTLRDGADSRLAGMAP